MFRRKRKLRGMLLPALLLAGLLYGCTAQEPEQVPEEPSGGAAMRPEQLADSARPLSEDEILSAYHRAVMLCGWFELTPLPDDGQMVLVDSVAYRHVSREGVETLEDLRTCLRSVFSQEVTERLLATGGETPRYRDIDGELYVTGEGRSLDSSKGRAEIEVQQTEDAAYAVNVTVDLLDVTGESVTGLECWSFPYAFVEDRWVFTDFRLVN